MRVCREVLFLQNYFSPIVFRPVSVYLPEIMEYTTVQFIGNAIWRHGSASILGTTRIDNRAPILMYWAGLSRIASPQERRPK